MLQFFKGGATKLVYLSCTNFVLVEESVFMRFGALELITWYMVLYYAF